MTSYPVQLLGSIEPETCVALLVGMGLAYLTVGLGWIASTLSKRNPLPPAPAPEVAPVGPPAMTIPSKAPEKRGFIRRSGNAVPVYFTLAGSDELQEGAWVIDRSAGGLCLSMEKPLEVGTVLRIRPTKAQVTAPWIEIQVRSCRREDSNWELGCQFVTIPAYNTLLLLG